MNYITAAGVQQFSITIASGSLTGTATISAVGSGAFILFGGINPSNGSNPSLAFAYVTLTNSTTITATRNTSTSGTVVVTGSIVDGDTTNLIKSVQYGTVSIGAASTSGTAAINAVTNGNTAIHLLGWKSASTILSPQAEYPVLTLSGTTVTATRQSSASGAALTVGFVAIEFQGTALNQNVQNVAATSSASVTSYTAAITSVVVNNSICIYGGMAAAGATPANTKQYGTLTSSTVLTANINTAVAIAKKYNCTVVEFISGVLNSAVQRNTTTLTGATSNTSTITGVTRGDSAISWLGNSTTVATSALDQAEGDAVLTSGTVVTLAKVTATGNITGSWEVAEFVPFSAGQIFMGWLPQYS
jgi:hypothetical protein